MLHIAYCKDVSHTNPVVLAAGDKPCSVVAHGVHTDTGTLTKSGEDFQALLATQGAGLFAYLKTTFGSEMT